MTSDKWEGLNCRACLTGARLLQRKGGQSRGAEPLGLCRLARLETEFFLALADSRPQVVRHAFAQPIDWMDVPSRGPCAPPLCTTMAA